jgi:serine/threonine protein kinase
MALKPGDLLLNGQYRIEGQLGHGGFGSVYRAHDTHLREDVAIKEMIPGLVGDEETLKRFLAEAKATMRLSHDRIVRTHHVFAEGEGAGESHYYIVMEYMAGGSLEEWLDEKGQVPVATAVAIGGQVAEGLAYAHDRGVVHCDLKPANILFTADLEASDAGAKVADFGIAHVSEQMLTRTWHTSAGFVAGTLPYMSPEQTRGQRDDPRLDVYALGAVLYHMITGRIYLDFGEEDTPYTLADNILRIHNEQPAPPSVHSPGVPSWLDGVILKALHKQPEDRFATIADMQAALLEQGQISRTPVSDAPIASARPLERPAPPPAAPDVVPKVEDVLPPTPLPPDWDLGLEDDETLRPSPDLEETIPQLADLRGQLARSIEEARRIKAESKRETRADHEERRRRESERRRQEGLEKAEEAIQRAVERVQRHAQRRIEHRVLDEQLAPLLEQVGSMWDGVSPALEQLGSIPGTFEPDAEGKVPIWQRLGIGLIQIPAGVFLYGDDKVRVDLPGYYLAQLPVTNAQYKVFVKATGHPAPRHWKKGRIPRGRKSHPVVNVSWHDAVVFCEWAGCRLPTEHEWEKGARGTDGLEYPWGDEWEEERCNTAEAGIGDTTPARKHPQGASPYGLLDMAGNVWEWCQDWAEEKKKHKVLRGGAWDQPSARARCASRHKWHPESGSDMIGFRVALTPGPSEP